MLIGLSMGIWLGAWGAFKLLATIMSLGLILVYALVSAALPSYFLRQHRSEFSRIRHLLVPVVCVLLLLPPLYGTIWPALSFPYNLAPYIVIAWVLIGGYRLMNGQRSMDFTPRLGTSLGE